MKLNRKLLAVEVWDEKAIADRTDEQLLRQPPVLARAPACYVTGLEQHRSEQPGIFDDRFFGRRGLQRKQLVYPLGDPSNPASL